MVNPLVRLADGTVIQVGPLTGTQVWTIPGRSHRPLATAASARTPLEGSSPNAVCAFCSDRYLEATPEKARLVRDGDGRVRIDRRRGAAHLSDDVAQVRRFANLFEIVSAASWRINHGFIPSQDVHAWAADYLADPVGRAHVLALTQQRAKSGGVLAPPPGNDGALLEATVDLLSGSHDVVVARRHLIDGAEFTDELAGSGSLSPAEHADFIDFTIDGLREQYTAQPAARYVSVFQNWLRPAGASFEHLHKQLVGIDSYGPQVLREIGMLRADPHTYSRSVIDLALRERLVVAANDGAVAIAGVGHRYPSLEVYSTAREQLPWEHSPAQRRAVSDLLHALHAATGVSVATNEEWHHRPPDVSEPMPWRIVLKWRLSIPAGFEGGTKIYVNTIDPWTLRERVCAELVMLRNAGLVAGMAIGSEVTPESAQLHYADA